MSHTEPCENDMLPEDPQPTDSAPSTDRSSGPLPLILFDGVCNLCNATVQWVIERDRRGLFHFASLQSEAARSAIESLDPGTSIESLPDSIVLVDEAGVHTRSGAVLRIARRLRFPYSLAATLLVAPRPLRDWVYGWVARNRYRWFGRRDSCMLPTPELAGRFLDAGEPRTVLPPSDPEPSEDPSPGVASRWSSAWLVRFTIVYVLVYMAPFPLTLLGNLGRLPLVADIPGLMPAVGWLISLHGSLVTPVVTWLGATAFGVEASPTFTGSGDTTFNHLDLLFDLTLAILICTAWTVAVRARRLSLTTLDVSRVLARFYLATTMLVYGWIKFFPLQFSVPTPDRLIQPYGDSSPMGLAWTFMGASVGYQMFAGLSELVGGYLLFWRRTTLLGALVSAAALMNVMAVNYFFDVPVKLFSTHLFLMAVFIMAPDLPRLVGLFGFSLPVSPRRARPFWQGSAGRALAVGTLHLLFVAMITGFHISDGFTQSRTRGVLAAPAPLAGIYRVQSFEQAGRVDRENEDAARWVRVGLNPATIAGTILRASGDAERMRIAVDTVARTLSFYPRGGQAPEEPQFDYREPDPGVVRLEGRFEGKSTVVVLQKDTAEVLLTGTGFRWINEFPFNR